MPGTIRQVSPSTKKYAQRKGEYSASISTGDYDFDKSYFSVIGGGYLLYHKERDYDKYEYEAAKYLAESGYKVELTPEKGEMYVTAKYNGKEKYSDGIVFGVTYEQKTPKPEGDDFDKNVTKAIKHAKDKGSRVALIYDAHNYLHRYNIRKGMDDYMKYHGHSPYNTVRKVIVVNSEGKVYEWSFDK